MSTRKKSSNFVQRLLKQSWRFFDAVTKAVVNWLLRSLLIFKRRSRLSRAGFVLPTVVMVILVVTLLTTAIMIRSFDRSKNASNVRVDQAVLKAATPALDRARAKIYSLFSEDETRLKGNTPDEKNIAEVFEDSQYTLGDETRIQLEGKFDTAPTDSTAEKLKTAWKFPVDTDNNGKFDTYTLYGIYFRNPQPDEPNRRRGTTEARALPQDNGAGKTCGSSGAGGTPGWYPINGQLKKAFFTYVANVPITDAAGLDATKYEPYKGNKGFSALEMQLDQARTSLDNNAVWYEDDLTISSVRSLRLNGRVHTNSNLLVSNPSGAYINFLQVSSIDSCFYNPDNAKIVVGGNVTAGEIGEDGASSDNSAANAVMVDLYRGDDVAPTSETIVAVNKTTQKTPVEVAGNSDAYAQRLNVLVKGARNLHDQNNPTETDEPTEASVSNTSNRYPQEIIDEFKNKIAKLGSNPGAGASAALDQTLTTYFADRIRRVSLAEVPINEPPTPDLAITVGSTKMSADITPTNGQFVFSGSGELTPPMQWMLIQDPSSGDVTNYTKLLLNFDGNGMKMPATDPALVKDKIENHLGDRILVGNNLPHVWVKDASVTPPEFAEKSDKQPVKNGTSDVNWNTISGGLSGKQRQRTGLVEQLDDLGNTSRNGFWEQAAAKPLADAVDLSGGLRVVTGAGIYVDDAPVAQFGIGYHYNAIPSQSALFKDSIRSFLPKPALTVDPTQVDLPTISSPTDYKVVWPDTMPMYQWDDSKGVTPNVPEAVEQLKGDLQMRATVVYRYQEADLDPIEPPIACISSYYDPTDKYTADNDNGISNNGKNYPVPSRTVTVRLENQAKMVFPDGRWVNKPLYDALEHIRNGDTQTLSDAAAIDAANCALSILDNPAGATPVAVGTSGQVADGAIKERAFLDARQIKAIHKPKVESNNLNINGITSKIDVKEETRLKDIGNPEQFKNTPLENFTDPDRGLSDKYTLPLELRQPLEVRVTEIDLDSLRKTPLGIGSTPNYLLPNSGIIYATRDDALPDISSDSAATDFKLDPTRRPNGIRLINGSNLERDPNYRPEEKGLILASDLPVYIKGDFNLHRASGSTSGKLEEFKDSSVLAFGGPGDKGNFYTRRESDIDKSFACRIGAPNCTGNGDQWRAARILSDAITLLSDDFRDGYRIEGNYDLNNNAGNSAVEAYLKQGFWANNFATTSQWYQTTDGFPRIDGITTDDNSGKSSYVMNGVTPIQRRVEFPEYKMEICKKLPVSECGPNDWLPNDPLAGTTATPVAPTYPAAPAATEVAARYEREHYARRVAFARDEVTHQLLLDDRGFAQPLAADGTRLSYISPPSPGTAPLNPVPNALWFATTANPNNPSDNPSGSTPGAPGQDDLQYDGANLLYYAPPEPETATFPAIAQERQFLLPGTPAFPKELQTIAALQGVTGRTLLNGSTTTDPSDYAVCTGANNSKTYRTDRSNLDPSTPCPQITLIKAGQMRDALATQLPGNIDKIIFTNPTPLDFANPYVKPGTARPVTARAKVTVYDFQLPADGKMKGRIVLNNPNNQSDPIFVFRLPRTFGQPAVTFDSITLDLNGVDPNNIFWVINQGPVVINTAKTPGSPVGSTGNALYGTFLGRGKLTVNDLASIKGGRLLGFNQSTFGTTGSMTALTTTTQPLLVPVLQLHAPESTIENPGRNQSLDKRWVQEVTQETTFNAVFVMGDSPARPVTGNEAESNGGLANFPRFLEAWSEGTGPTDPSVAAKISGGLIQLKRSAFATAPFETVSNPRTDTSLFFDDQIPPALSTFDNTTGGFYRYLGGASAQKAPYYMPPDRQWGYDVGLLSQTPDLFSRRFTTPPAGTPSEFYREVSRDDSWVKTLMCGTLVDPRTGNATTTPALPPGQRPSSCP